MALKAAEPDNQIIGKLVGRYEARFRTWPRTRWALVVVSLFSTGVAVAATINLGRIVRAQRDSVPNITGLSPAQEKILAYVEARVALLIAEMRMILAMIFCGWVGGTGLFLAIAQWNGHMYSALIARALRDQLQGSDTGTNPT